MKSVKPSGIEGAVDAPPSKSEMQRALILAALAEGSSTLANPSFCDDALATMGVVEALGAEVGRGEGRVLVAGGGKPRSGVLDCGESGTCMRMIAPVAALYGAEFTITGRGSLMNRPMGMMEAPLRALGAGCRMLNGRPPISVKGPMHGGRVSADCSESSQFLSGLLLSLPLCMEDSEVEALGLKSGAYAGMTAAMAQLFGAAAARQAGGRFIIKGGQKYRPASLRVAGDWSGAAFMLVAGAIAGRAVVRNLATGSGQPDEAIAHALKGAGAEVKADGSGVRAGCAASGRLRAFTFDATGCPDLFPPLAALACSCEGRSAISGVERLRHKESDRAAALAAELGGMGAEIRIAGNRMEITGRKLGGGTVDTHGDHRIAMACAVAALASEKGVRIENESCVSKSYPGFFADLARLGAIVE